jgi:hypothetical protein
MGFKAPNVGIAVATTRLGNAEDHKKILKLPTIIDVFVY